MKKNSRLSFVLIVLLILSVFAGCASTKSKSAETGNTPTASAVAKTEPVTDVPKTEEIKVEEKSEIEKTVESKKDSKYTYIYDFAGYEIRVEVLDGYGYVTYPAFITDAEIAEALKAFATAYGDFGITYKKVEAGKLEVSFPKGLAKADFDYAAGIAADSLTWYLEQIFDLSEGIQFEEKIEVAKVSETAEPKVKKEEPVVAEQLKASSPVPSAEDTVASEKKEMPAILIILIILVAIAAVYFCYMRFFKKMKRSNKK